ncbi:MAG: methylated-DNA--[protein]-cysteine S-methyltransferase [Bacillota bacterium]|nr:methylated-DNA--[protein]-cysteine S-methyltransferase [Bacillota bacterium]
MGNVLKCYSFETAIGSMTAAYTGKGLCRLSLPKETEEGLARWADRFFRGYTLEEACDDTARDIERQITEYLAGRRSHFSVGLDLKGTAFQRRVWQALLQIPYGETATYKDIAAATGAPRAVRAVGQANNRNPVPIIVPCHRVIGSDGSLVGYGGGIDIKRRLLELEGVTIAKGKVEGWEN